MSVYNPIIDSPTGGSTIDATIINRMSWQFLTSTGDATVQFSYQVVILNLDNTTAHDTGIINSVNEYYDLPATTLTNGNDYKWRVTVNGIRTPVKASVFDTQDIAIATVDAIPNPFLVQLYEFTGTVTQAQGDIVRSFQWTLYDSSLFNYADNGTNYINWTIQGTGTTKGTDGIHLVEDNTPESALLPLALATSTEHTIFYDVSDSSLALGVFALTGGNIIADDLLLDGTVGVKSQTLTTQSSISNNEIEFKIKEYNSVSNPYFSDGTTGWISKNGALLSLSDNILTVTPVAQFSGVEQIIDFSGGDKYFIYARIKADTDLVRLFIYNTLENVVYHSGSGEYEELFAIVTSTLTSTRIAIQDFRSSGWTDMEVDGTVGVFAINMTELGIEDFTEAQMLTLVQNMPLGTTSFVDFELLSVFEGDQTSLSLTEELPYGDYDQIISQSPVIIGEDVEYEFSGLENNLKHKVDFNVTMQSGLTATSDRPSFTTNYTSPVDPDAIVVSAREDLIMNKMDWTAVVTQVGQVYDSNDDPISANYTTGVWNQALDLGVGEYVRYDLNAPIPFIFSENHFVKLASGFDGAFFKLYDSATGLVKYEIGYLQSTGAFYYERDFRRVNGLPIALSTGFMKLIVQPRYFGFEIGGTEYIVR